MKFNEVWEELHKSNMEVTKNRTNKNVPHSKKKKSLLTQALLNDVDYETTVVKSKDGAYTHEKQKPVEEFRKQFIGKVLSDNGVDKQQVEDAVRNYQYSQKQADALYGLETEDIEQYMRAGFSFKFQDKPDLSASIRMRDVEDRTVSAKSPATGEVTKTFEKAHKVIVPKYLKKKV